MNMDTKSLVVGLALGYFVLPRVVGFVASRKGGK